MKLAIKELIEIGKLNLGEPCSPYSVIKSSVVDGQLQNITSDVFGRKISMLDIRKLLLSSHERFMRLSTDQEIDALADEEMKVMLESIGEPYTDESYHTLKKLQRSRSLTLWHDHSNILGQGYLLMTIHVLYDPAVFFTDSEYKEMSSERLSQSIQELV